LNLKDDNLNLKDDNLNLKDDNLNLKDDNLNKKNIIQTIYLLTKLYNTYKDTNNKTINTTIIPNSGILISLFSFGVSQLGWDGFGEVNNKNTDNYVIFENKKISLYMNNTNNNLPCQYLGLDNNPYLRLDCPPYTGPGLRCDPRAGDTFYCFSLGKIISFSYIRKDLSDLLKQNYANTNPLNNIFDFNLFGRYGIIYDNTNYKNMLNIDCTYPTDGGTNVYCSDISFLGCYTQSQDYNETPCYYPHLNKWEYKDNNPPSYYANKTMIDLYKNNLTEKNNKNIYNEVIIKSWNYDKYNTWGWNDPSLIATDFKKPILAYTYCSDDIIQKNNSDYITLYKMTNYGDYPVIGLFTNSPYDNLLQKDNLFYKINYPSIISITNNNVILNFNFWLVTENHNTISSLLGDYFNNNKSLYYLKFEDDISSIDNIDFKNNIKNGQLTDSIELINNKTIIIQLPYLIYNIFPEGKIIENPNINYRFNTSTNKYDLLNEYTVYYDNIKGFIIENVYSYNNEYIYLDPYLRYISYIPNNTKYNLISFSFKKNNKTYIIELDKYIDNGDKDNPSQITINNNIYTQVFKSYQELLLN
jgi:hypothetical protein